MVVSQNTAGLIRSLCRRGSGERGAGEQPVAVRLLSPVDPEEPLMAPPDSGLSDHTCARYCLIELEELHGSGTSEPVDSAARISSFRF